MPIELTMLGWAVVLTLVQLVVSVIATSRAVPMPVLMGNRDDMPVVTGVAARAQRAHRNMLETLPLFAALALIVVVTHRTNPRTAFAAEAFVAARAAYAVIYVAGLPWLRTIAWAAAIGALLPLLHAVLAG